MIKLLIAGDFCPQDRIAGMIEKNDFSFFEEIRPITSSANYSIVNLECPIADETCEPILKSGPNLKCTSKALSAIKYGGFDGVTLANNHLNDYGEQAITITFRELNSSGINSVGAGRTLDESNKPLIKEIYGKKIAIVNFCESEFSIATKYSAGASPLDLVDNQRNIATCRSCADFVIVIVHGGHEMHQLPSPLMQKTYRWFVEMGADAVINHHQHCYSGYEIYKNRPIFYGLGNFCFDKPTYRNSIWNEGYIVMLKLDNEISFDIIPYHQCDADPTIQIMKYKDLEKFYHSLASLNNIIADPLLVEADFERYYKGAERSVLGLFSPYSNRYLRGAAQKGLIPSLLPKKKIARIYDYINCDAHRNIALRCLRDMI